MKTTRQTWAASLVSVICAFACASTPPPTARMATAESSIRTAQALGAEEVPTAALHVNLARQQLDKAHALTKKSDNRQADMMAQRATADADLAMALSREEGALRAAERARNEVQQGNTYTAPDQQRMNP
jgi:predicted acylesterase/phospholipase RssA